MILSFAGMEEEEEGHEEGHWVLRSRCCAVGLLLQAQTSLC